ncbi:Hypothetical predicted protein [Podarcis lilfordi]|uniref:Uncharacterized protein n=1 Tax=Podarcis lilfordi TaxID=74358 RepID=A0AA35P2G4_9SAUR|nr:Hypothetical predicted protein [Podarcis lilfordi]
MSYESSEWSAVEVVPLPEEVRLRWAPLSLGRRRRRRRGSSSEQPGDKAGRGVSLRAGMCTVFPILF